MSWVFIYGILYRSNNYCIIYIFVYVPETKAEPQNRLSMEGNPSKSGPPPSHWGELMTPSREFFRWNMPTPAAEAKAS